MWDNILNYRAHISNLKFKTLWFRISLTIRNIDQNGGCSNYVDHKRK